MIRHNFEAHIIAPSDEHRTDATSSPPHITPWSQLKFLTGRHNTHTDTPIKRRRLDISTQDADGSTSRSPCQLSPVDFPVSFLVPSQVKRTQRTQRLTSTIPTLSLPSASQDSSDHQSASQNASTLHTLEPAQISSDHYGDNPNHKSDSTFRIYFQNKHLHTKKNNSDLAMTVHGIADMKADFVGFTESNVNWDHPDSLPILRQALRQHFQHIKLSPARANLVVPSQYQPGGVIAITVNTTTGRVTDTHQDLLGRWSIQFMRSHTRHIAIITAYQLPVSKRLGPCNIYTQQLMLLNTGDDPRKAFCQDLCTLLLELHSKGALVVLGGDFNENLNTSPQFQEVFATLGLVDCHSTYHILPTPATHLSGSTTIDYVYASLPLYHTIRGSGITAPNWKITSDHRGMFVDFHSESFFSQAIPIVPSTLRKLRRPTPEQRQVYIATLNSYLDNHNVPSRLAKFQANPNGPELRQLDQDLTKAMLAAEQKICRKSTTPWSPELRQLRLTHRYWQLRLCEVTQDKLFT